MSINSKFTQVVNPMLKIFESQSKDTSLIDMEYIQKFSQDGSDIKNVNKPLYEILVTDRDAWLNLSESFIEARFKIVRNDTGADITAGNIALVNNGFNLFKRAEYQYDGKGILETVEYPGIKNQIMGLLNNSQDSEKSLTNELWYPDRGNGLVADLTQAPLVFSIGGVAQAITNTAQNVLGIAAGADNAVISVTFKGYPVTFQFGDSSDGVLAQLLKNGGAANDPIDYAGIGAGQRLTFYANGLPLRIFNNGVPAYFYANVTPNIALSGIAAANRTITAAFDYSTAIDEQTFNIGFNERKKKFCNATGTYDKVHTVYLPLRKLFGFFDYNRVVLKGATHKISLYTNDIGRSLFRDAGAVDGRIKFYSLNWWIPYAVPNRLLGDQMTQKLVSGAEAAVGFYDWKYVEYPTTLTNGSTSQIQWTIQQDTVKPVRVFIFFQPENANSDQTINSMVFSKTFVQTARCIVNSNVHYPKEEYNLDFSDNAETANISRAYLEFLRAGHHAFSSHAGPSISIEEYKALYPIITFDLSKQDDSKIYEYVGTNTLQVKLTFSQGHPANLKLYACILNERVASLKGSGNKVDLLTQ